MTVCCPRETDRQIVDNLSKYLKDFFAEIKFQSQNINEFERKDSNPIWKVKDIAGILGKILSPILAHITFTVRLHMGNYSGYGQLGHNQYS